MRKFNVLLVLISCLAATSVIAERKEYSRIIEVDDYTYEIEVGGFRDPLNETIIIENLGEEPLVNPRITVNGKYDWFDLETMAREAVRGCRTDEEKAFAIYNFVRTQSHHLSPPRDMEALNPVVYFNVYGYGQCAFHATTSVHLARALGMQARVWEVWKHTVNEFWYDNAWHMLDSDIEAYYLREDNRSIASIEQLWADQKITGGKPENAGLTRISGRTVGLHAVYTDVEGNIGWAYRDSARALGARYFFADDFCHISDHYDYYAGENHTMAMTIRPNEKLIRNWKGGEKYWDYRSHLEAFAKDPKPWRKPIRYGDGQIVWKPDLRDVRTRQYVDGQLWTEWAGQDGQEPAVHVKYRQGGVYDIPTRLSFPVYTPYVILGGKLKANVYRGADNTWDRVSISARSGRGFQEGNLWKTPDGATGSIEVNLDLDEFLYPEGTRGRHDYAVQFTFAADEKNNPPTQSGIDSIEMVTDIQCAPNSLPALSLGRNIIRYRDETPGVHKVKITHIWHERTDNHPPVPPAKPVYPKDAGEVEDLAPLFSWPAARDPDQQDDIADYYVTLSFDPLCRWPISTTLMTETGSSKPQWKLAEGWLNRDTTYYWQVKARDSRGIWGEWSPVFSFKTSK